MIAKSLISLLNINKQGLIIFSKMKNLFLIGMGLFGLISSVRDFFLKSESILLYLNFDLSQSYACIGYYLHYKLFFFVI